MVINDISKDEMPISLKAYGDGPLQLSTDKSFTMFLRLAAVERNVIDDSATIVQIFQDPAFSSFAAINLMPLIYNDKLQQCNILIFDYALAKDRTARIVKSSSGRGRKHPVFTFLDYDGDYICEVRYGNATANALQRGLWTHTKKAAQYFESITDGWINYTHNHILVKLFSHALVSSSSSHEIAFAALVSDIQRLKKDHVK